MKLLKKLKDYLLKPRVKKPIDITYTPLNGVCKWKLDLITGDSWDYWGFYAACNGNNGLSDADAKALSCAMYTVLSEYLINRITLDKLLNIFDEIMKCADFNFCEKYGGKIVIELDGKSLGIKSTINTTQLTLN